jgi:pimeloyl-ACP methyl ester carboxylesterase
MPIAKLDAGPIAYDDTGDALPVVVLVGGLVIGPSLWHEVVEDLRADFRCIVPTLPWGAHPHAMNASTDLSLSGQARILADFIENLDLDGVTLVEVDSAMAQVLITTRPERIERVVLCSCETSDNFPPGLPGRCAAMAARIPGGVYLAIQQMRFRAFRRSPFGFGRMAKRPISDELVDQWIAPALADRAVRRDLAKYLRSVRDSRHDLEQAFEGLGSFSGPALVIWATEDRVMPIASGRTLAGAFSAGRFIDIDDSYTLIPLDQPRRLATEIRAFIGETITSATPSGMLERP